MVYFICHTERVCLTEHLRGTRKSEPQLFLFFYKIDVLDVVSAKGALGLSEISAPPTSKSSQRFEDQRSINHVKC